MGKCFIAVILSALILSSSLTGYVQGAAELSVSKRNLDVTIYLIDGSILEGRILDSSENTITIEPSSGGKIIASRDNIKEIKQGRLLAGADVEKQEQKNERQYEKPSLSVLSVVRVTSEVSVGAIAGLYSAYAGASVGLGLRYGYWEGVDHETDRTDAGVILGACIGCALANATAVYLIGNIGNETGQFLSTLSGSSLVAGIAGLLIGFSRSDKMYAILFLGTPIGATIGFNLTRRYDSPPARSETALINYREGRMSLAVPRVYFRADSFGRGNLSQSVDLLRVRF